MEKIGIAFGLFFGTVCVYILRYFFNIMIDFHDIYTLLLQDLQCLSFVLFAIE